LIQSSDVPIVFADFVLFCIGSQKPRGFSVVGDTLVTCSASDSGRGSQLVVYSVETRCRKAIIKPELRHGLITHAWPLSNSEYVLCSDAGSISVTDASGKIVHTRGSQHARLSGSSASSMSIAVDTDDNIIVANQYYGDKIMKLDKTLSRWSELSLSTQQEEAGLPSRFRGYR